MIEPSYITAKAAEQKQQPDEEGVLRFVASTNEPDRHGDTIDQGGWTFPDYIPFLWQHDHSKPPLGRITRRIVERQQLMLDVEFDLDGEFASEVHRKYVKGVLEPVSVGFIGLEGEPNNHGGVHFTEQELLELSAVPVGANPGAGMEESALDQAVTVAKAARLVDGDLESIEALAKAIQVVGGQSVREEVDGEKDGRVLSEENYKDVKDARNRLDRVLGREDRAPEEDGGDHDDENKELGQTGDATERRDSGASGEADRNHVLTLSRGGGEDDEGEAVVTFS